MYLMCVSLNYHRLPVNLREKFAFTKEQVPVANKLLHGEKSILENLIVSTCNRTEVYAVVDQIHTGRYYIKSFLSEWFDCSIEEFSRYIVISLQKEAVEHLFRVVTGLDSLIRGEPQILGQIKDAFKAASTENTTGVILNHLFRQAITFSKKMHTKYKVSELAQSAGQAGLHQIKTDFGSLKGQKIAIVGMGHIGKHTAYNASNMGFSSVLLLNRTNEKAQKIATELKGVVRARPFSALSTVMNQVNAVVFATSAQKPLLTVDDLFLRSSTVKIIVDLGVPRNVEIEKNGQIHYYDIDHLHSILNENSQKKQKMLKQITAAIPAEIDDFYVWEKELHIVPVIRGLREHSLKIEGVAYDSLLRKLPELNVHERKVIEKHMRSIINQMIKGPIKEVKELSVTPGAKTDIDFFCKIFGMSDLKVAEQKNEQEN